MLFDTATATQALEDLLDHERKMILSGAMVDLARIVRQKEQLVARLANHPDEQSLARVRRKAERNQGLLTASARGLKAARGRIGDIAAGQASMRTYGADGAAQEMGFRKENPGINHRA